MTKQIICANCGESMLECYTKKGLRLYVCKHKSAKTLNDRVGKPKHVLIYCDHEIFGLKQAFENMTAETNLTIKKLREATENKIDDSNLYKSANLALELDFEKDRLPELFNAAMTLGYSLGLEPRKSIESLVIGIARQSRKVLDNLGVIFSTEQAYRWYMVEHNKTEILTEEERQEAWKKYAVNEVITKAENIRKKGVTE
ncbi:hypothetical protein D4R42_05510 [bacterium]|nr:MAG: hypothetical protein D4R42_05510 [bacterium]